MKKSWLAAGLLLGTAAFACVWMWHAAAGFSARAQPTRFEAVLARTARSAATPAAWKSRQNPVATTPGVLREATAHYADHCAVCHGNDGAGKTMLGSGMYPQPPDMRQSETQHKTDGELFSMIENGIRMSGMPAFGNGSGDPTAELESWKLVVFLRHLPVQTAEEARAMDALNPKTADEFEEEKQEADFLAGKNADSNAGASGKKQGASSTHAHTSNR